MTLAPAAPAAATAELNGIILQLDNLHAAYASILEQAQSQLENLDLTDEQMQRVCSRIVDDSNRRGEIAALAVQALRRELDEHDRNDDSNQHWLLRRLANSVEYASAERHRDDTRRVIEELIRDRAFQSALDHEIERTLAYPTGELSRNLRYALRSALNGLFNADDLRQLLDVPSDAEYRTTTEAEIARLRLEVSALNSRLDAVSATPRQPAD